MTNFDDILAYARARTDRFNAARSTIESLTIDPAPSTDPHRPDTDFDRADETLRILLCESDLSIFTDMLIEPIDLDFDAYESPRDTTIALLRALHELFTLAADHSNFAREYLTTLALDHSLCPLHFTDYAICFDDDDDECRAIRAIHPTHDT